MITLLVGIILIVLAYSLAMPYALYLICLIAGVILTIYGLFVLFRVLGGSPSGVEPVTRRRRFWY